MPTGHYKRKTKKKWTRRPLPPRLEPPKGSPPANVWMQTHKSDARFVNVRITGVIQTDIALSVLALVQPERDSEQTS